MSVLMSLSTSYLHAQLLIHATEEQRLPAMIAHGVLDLHLGKSTVGILVFYTCVQIKIHKLLRGHGDSLVSQLGLHIAVVPRCPNIIMPAYNPIDRITD